MLNKKIVLSGVALLLLQVLQPAFADPVSSSFQVSGNITQNTCSISANSDIAVNIPEVSLDDINVKTSDKSRNNGTIQNITVLNCAGGSSLSVIGDADTQDSSLLAIDEGGAQNVAIAFWYLDENKATNLIDIGKNQVLEPSQNQSGAQSYTITVAPVEMAISGPSAATPGAIHASATLQLNTL